VDVGIGDGACTFVAESRVASARRRKLSVDAFPERVDPSVAAGVDAAGPSDFGEQPPGDCKVRCRAANRLRQAFAQSIRA
jgi:hypothetical protein